MYSFDETIIILIFRENTQNSIKRPSSARPNSSRVVGTAVVSPVSIQKITEHLSFDEGKVVFVFF